MWELRVIVCTIQIKGIFVPEKTQFQCLFTKFQVSDKLESKFGNTKKWIPWETSDIILFYLVNIYVEENLIHTTVQMNNYTYRINVLGLKPIRFFSVTSTDKIFNLNTLKIHQNPYMLMYI